MALSLHSPSSFITTSSITKTNNTHHEDNNFPTSISIHSNNASAGKEFKCCRLRAATYESPAVAGSRSEERLHVLRSGASGGHAGRVPVYVMMPLDTVLPGGGGLSRGRALNASLMALKSAGAEGVMVDVWWGLVEREGPLRYNWEAYAELVRMVEKHGLKLQMVMSFHQCGGNVGDSCSIPLPPWVHEEIGRNPDIMYTDRSGRRSPEYISLGCDTLPVLRGRTPIQAYADYMRSFRDRFRDYLGNVILEIQVGLGPRGELRYPSYPETNGTWRLPGIGEFQCYDEYMKASLQASAVAFGQKEWGGGGPHDFFRREGGEFLLEWYSNKLIEHGDRVLASAEAIFGGTGAKLSAKVAGIHWNCRTRSHAAELAAGYYNTRHRDGYASIGRMLAKRGAVLSFTRMEMVEGQQAGHANCWPELLVRRVKATAEATGVEVAAENALERYDESAFAQVLATSKASQDIGFSSFTYLRMNKRMFEGQNWRNFVWFVKSMSEVGRRDLRRIDSGHFDY